MSKIQLEELETRLLLSGGSVSPCSAPSPLPTPDSGHSSTGVAGGSDNIVQPGDGVPGQAQFLIQNSASPGNPGNGDPGMGNLSGAQKAASPFPSSAPSAATSNLGAGQPSSQVVPRGDEVPSAEQTFIKLTSDAWPPPFEAGGDFLGAIHDFFAPVTAIPPLPFVLGINVTAGIVNNTGWFQLPSLPAVPANPISPDRTVQEGAPAQNRPIPSPPLQGIEPTVPLANLLYPGPQATPLGPLPLTPHSPQALPLVPPALGFPDQAPLSLSPVDLSALESALLHFLADLGQTTSQLVTSREAAPLRMWLLAGAGAGIASLIAYRQQRRSAGLCATDVPQLPGCSVHEDE